MRGCTVQPVRLPHTKYAIACYYILATAEASSNLARFDGVRYGHRAGGQPDLRGMYGATRGAGFGDRGSSGASCWGTYVLSAGYYDAYYLKALKVRTLLRQVLRASLPRGGRDRSTDLAHAGLAVRREARQPALDVPRRCVHAPGKFWQACRRCPCHANRWLLTRNTDHYRSGYNSSRRHFRKGALCAVASAWEARNPSALQLPALS